MAVGGDAQRPATVELVRRARDGDRDAFDALLRGMVDRLFAVAYRVVRDWDVADEVVQQTLVSAWRDLPQLREADRFEAWLHRLLLRSCYREAKRTRRRHVVESTAASSGDVAPPESAIADRDRLDRAFARLTVEHRAVLVLSHYLELTGPEIARVLDIPPGTVKSRTFHALRALRAALEASERDVRRPGAGATPMEPQ